MIGEKQVGALMRPVMGQFERPHGPFGWLAALIIPMGHRPSYARHAMLLDLQPDDVLLDVGCGSGDFLAERAAHVGKVVGLDISDIEVRLARRKLHDRIEAGTADVVHGDAAALPFADGEFTAVNGVGVFLAFDDPVAPVAEMYRVLRPGGRAVVNLEMHGGQDGDRGAVDSLTGARLYTEPEVRDVFVNAGFPHVSFTYDGDTMIVKGVKGP